MTLPQFLADLAVELETRPSPPPECPYRLGELVKYYPPGGKPWVPAVFSGCRRECTVNTTRAGVSLAFGQWVFGVHLPMIGKDGQLTGFELVGGLMGDRLAKLTADDLAGFPTVGA